MAGNPKFGRRKREPREAKKKEHPFQGRIARRSVWFLVCCEMLGLIGCAGLKTDLQYRPPVTLNPLYTREANGLRVTIDPIFEESRAREVFGVDPRRLGIFAVHVRIENRGRDAGLLIQAKNFEFLPTVGPGPSSKPEGAMYRPETEGGIGGRIVSTAPADRAVRAMVAFALGTGAFPEYSAEINHNFVREEIRDTTLEPGQATSGCVYFQVPRGQTPERGILRLTVPGPRTQQTTHIEIQVVW